METPSSSVSKPLPGAGTLISDSWKLFTSTWTTSIKTSGLMVFVGLAYLIVGILTHLQPALWPVAGVVAILAGFATSWIGIRLVLTMLKLEAGQQPLDRAEESRKAWALFFPMLWVGILVGLVVLGSSILLILPGIYFAIALNFSQTILIDQDIHGTKALAASRALVRGRWWAAFWRIVAGGVVFGLLIGVSVAVIGGIASLMSLPSASAASKEYTSTLGMGVDSSPLIFGISQFLQFVAIAALMPLMTGFQVKLYRVLQKTR